MNPKPIKFLPVKPLLKRPSRALISDRMFCLGVLVGTFISISTAIVIIWIEFH